MAIYLLNLYPSKEVNKPEILKWRGDNRPNPLKKNDTVIVTAHFGIYTYKGAPAPMDWYYGLSLGACFSSGTTQMMKDLDNKGYLGILKNITPNSTPGKDDFFTNALTFKEPITRDGETQDLTYMVQMIFNPGTDVIKKLNGMTDKEIDVVADYGDPHENYLAIPVDVS